MFILRIAYEAYLRFIDDDCWAIASYIAMSILTSMFPFLIFVTAIAGFFGTKGLSDEAARLLLDAMPEKVAGPLATEIHNVLTQPRSGLLTIGMVLAIYFSSSAVDALRVGLNRAYDVKDMRSWWLLRLEAIFYVLIGALALLSLAFLVVLGPLLWSLALRLLPALEPLAGLVTVARFGIASLILVVFLVVAHKYLPAGRRSWREIVPGIVLTLALWVAAGVAFGWYLSEFAANYVSTYAGLASVMIALVFLYMLAAIFIFGGELNAIIARGPAEIAPEAIKNPESTVEPGA